VQAVAASGIGLLVLGVAVARRRLPARREALAALIATGGLVALGLSVIGARAPRAHAIPAARMLACAGLVAGLACLLARRRSAGAGGTSAGLLYGLGDLATKALLVSLPVHAGVASVLLDPYLALALAAHAAGFVTLQRAFSRGGVVDAIAPLTAAMNLLPIVAGVVVLDDALPGSSLLLTLRLGAFAAAAIGAWLLARIRGRPAEPRTSQDMPPTPFEPGFAAWT
jgi:energy-converting hydrogenase Eha subunit A